jgi:hypothetical protein
MNLGTFHIDTLIVHDIPRRRADGSGDAIVFSDVPSKLDPGLRNFFRERIIRTLGRHAFEVERDAAQPSPVPGHIADLIGDPKTIVPASQGAARHLHATQTGVNPGGLLVVARGTVDKDQCCAILKLEHEEALRVQRTKRGNKVTFDMARLRDLMLGQNTRVFKASLFKCSDGTPGGVNGRVSDNQAGQLADGGVAGFFLADFLGCRLKEAPEVATRAFFDATQVWINTLPDPVTRGRYEVGLIAEMNTTANTVTPKTFADQHLDVADRASYRAHLVQQGAPAARFSKDTTLISSRIKQMSIRFATSSVRVSGNPEDVDKYVRINPPSTAAAPVEILDAVEEIRGGR